MPTSVTCPTTGAAVSRFDDLTITALSPSPAPPFDNPEAATPVALRFAHLKDGLIQREEDEGGGGEGAEDRRGGEEEKEIRRAMTVLEIFGAKALEERK